MIDDEAHAWLAAHDLQRDRHLPRADQQVVREARPSDGRDPAADLGAQQPLGVGLVMDRVADPDEAIAAGTSLQLGQDVGQSRIREIRPADDADDGRRSGRECEQPAGLVDVGPCLDDDRAVHPGRRRCHPEVVDPERAPDGIERVGHPRVAGGRGGAPQVVVRIDDAGHAGVGASDRMSPSCRSSSQSAAGIGSRIATG